MEYGSHVHQTLTGDDQKLLYHPDLHSHRSHIHNTNFHHRLSQDQHSPSQMDVKLIDTAPSTRTTRSQHAAYSHYDANQMVETSQFMGRSPCQVSPGSSPAPVSAAAEYMRQQELSRGTPRKRVYQDWNQVAIYNTPGEAEEGIKNFENCRWKVGNKFTSREGFKVYWSCREGASCPVQIHLLYHSQLPRVVLFRNQPLHHHAEKVKTRGLLPEVESLIRELFENGVNKPRRIQFILQKKGMEEVPQTKLSNFLVKLRREAALHGGPVNVKRERGNYQDELDEDDGPETYSQDDDKSNSTLSPSAMFPSVILSTPSEHGGSSMSGIPGIMQSGGYMQHSSQNMSQAGFGNAATAPPFGGSSRYHGYQAGVNEMYSPNTRQSSSDYSGRSSGSVAAAAGREEEADQSEVVTCSSSRRRSLYCRDETTEDGDNLQADEEHIKDVVLNHIRASYSNRDMLHIREELRLLKRENKYTALNRLLAFTAGFLQDIFLEKREADSPPAGRDGGEGEN